MHNCDDKKQCQCKSSGKKGLTRRGFITAMGAGTIGVAASGKLLAATSPRTDGTTMVEAEEMTPAVLSINGRNYQVLVEPRWTLLHVLREELGMTGTKVGCGRGECGSCTVLIDDVPRYACMTLALEAEGTKIITLEGLMDGEELGPVQQAFADEDAFQCGYCTPGQIMAVEGLLRANPEPSIEEVRRGVSGNLCRCGAYTNIFNAARRASKLKKGGGA